MIRGSFDPYMSGIQACQGSRQFGRTFDGLCFVALAVM